MRFSWTILPALIFVSTPVLAAETGDWLVEDGKAQIRIENCGGALWGFVAWEKEPGGRDTENPDPAKRDRPTLGLPILLHMQASPSTSGRWDGEVYNAQNGKTYTSHIALTDPNTLRIEGCVLGFLCGGQNWTRVTPAEAAAAQSAAPAPKGAAKSASAGATSAKTPATPPKAAPPKAAAPKAKNAKIAAAKPEGPSSLCSTLPELPGPAH